MAHWNRAAKACFEKIAPSHKKNCLVWINEAKKPETRASRVRKAVAMLAERRVPTEGPDYLLCFS